MLEEAIMLAFLSLGLYSIEIKLIDNYFLKSEDFEKKPDVIMQLRKIVNI